MESAYVTLQKLSSVEHLMPPNDGLRHFNSLYIEVTKELIAHEASFEDIQSVERLLTSFADLYFQALEDAISRPVQLSKAWAPLFENRFMSAVLPLQFAIAGMNAHINYDLSVALVTTWQVRGIDPQKTTPFNRDFDRINELLASVEERMRSTFIPEECSLLSGFTGRLGALLVMWNIRAAREAAWTNGVVVKSLRDAGVNSSQYLLTLGRTVGMASRGILRPI